MITEKQSRLLVCGAQNDIRRDMISLLGRIGFTYIDEAHDAPEAERLLCDREYALAVCDASIGSAETMQLAYNESRRADKNGQRGTALLLIGESAYSDVLREVCRMTGAVCLVRPYTIPEFCDSVLGALSARSHVTKLPAERAGAEHRDTTAEQNGTPKLPSESQITEILHTLGIPAHIKGFAYLRCAIGMTIADPDMINYVTKSLYPSVAKEYGTVTSRVERAIRHAIEVAWDRGDVETLNRYFGYTISRQRGKPTNSEFIAMISDKLRLGVGI